MWEAYAEYEDGTRIRRYFKSTCGTYESNYKSESEEQYELEEWLLCEHDGCTFYTVNWINDEE